jgi:hypothetical protein
MIIDVPQNKRSVYYNGTGVSTLVSDGSLADLTNTETFDIGYEVYGMELADLAVYNRVLSDTEWNDVVYRLGSRYGVQTSYVRFALLGLILFK